MRRLVYILPIYLSLYAACWFAAFGLRFEFDVPAHYLELLRRTLPLVLGTKFVTSVLFGEWRRRFRYATLSDLLYVGGAAVSSGVALFVANKLFFKAQPIPRSVLVIDGMLTVLTLSLARTAVRFHGDALRSLFDRNPEERAVVFGTDSRSLGILKTLDGDRAPFRVIGLLAVKRADRHTVIAGVPVLPLLKLGWKKLAGRLRFRHVLVPNSTEGRIVRDIVANCAALDVKVHLIPEVHEIMGCRSGPMIRDVTISDLLRREPTRLDRDGVRSCIGGRRVIVTGAAGSIGSELCRQILDLRPASLTFVDQSESGIFEIEQELRAKFADIVDLQFIVADVVDHDALSQVMNEQRPEILFHAAAYKHVPLMQSNPREAIRNNVFGTKNVIDLAVKHEVERFVLISTDKAVHPSNVMGATKFLAEKCVQSAAATSSTHFVTVRFGNVLNSAGSVIPTFRRQIEAGGPVTVTHPEMTRYFMMIPEAVQLVLQAATIGRSGDVLILEMGEPVKIVDLARDMILLSGLRYPEDIDIVFTGIRPGEKLNEQLFYGSENGTRKISDKIHRATCTPRNPLEITHDLARLEQAVKWSNEKAAAVLEDIVSRHIREEESRFDQSRKVA